MNIIQLHGTKPINRVIEMYYPDYHGSEKIERLNALKDLSKGIAAPNSKAQDIFFNEFAGSFEFSKEIKDAHNKLFLEVTMISIQEYFKQHSDSFTVFLFDSIIENGPGEQDYGSIAVIGNDESYQRYTSIDYFDEAIRYYFQADKDTMPVISAMNGNRSLSNGTAIRSLEYSHIAHIS